MNVEQKDIVLLPFPFSNMINEKVRPAIIISNNNYNNKSEDILAVAVTSVIKDEPYSIIIEQKDLKDGKLITKSRIRVDKIFSVEKRIVLKRIGSINEKTFEKIKKEIMKLI
jgi:mRNA interferase MazF